MKLTAISGVILIGFASATMHAAEKLDVRIVDRQDSERRYTYVVPGYSTSNSSGKVNCSSGAGLATCAGSGSTTNVNTPASARSYEVQGATFTLQLPDDRIAVVNCERKFNWGWEDWRSCRMPLGEDIQAEFKGDKAKLFWSVSIDGKKLESETYRILAVFEE